MKKGGEVEQYKFQYPENMSEEVNVGGQSIPMWAIMLCGGILVILVIGVFAKIWSRGRGGGPTPTAVIPFPLDPSFDHYILYGQSLSTGYGSLPIKSLTQPNPENVFTLSYAPRDIGSALVPLVEKENGKEGETPASALGNSLFEHFMNKKDHCKILVTAPGKGGSSVKELTASKLYSKYENACINGFNAMKTKSPPGEIHSPITFWVQGEKDKGNKNYESELKTLINKMEKTTQANYGEKCQVVSYQTGAYSGDGKAYVPKAQLKLHNENVLSIATPIYFIEHAADDLHLSTRGSQVLGAYFARAAWCIKKGERPPLLMPVTAERKDEFTIHIKFDVPTKPLRLTSTVADNYGFNIKDTKISTVTVVNDDTIKLTLGDSATSPVTVQYALGPTKILKDCGTGGLKDSCTETTSIGPGGDSVVLANWCPHFELLSN